MRVKQIRGREMWTRAEIVEMLDRYIIGQKEAKRVVVDRRVKRVKRRFTSVIKSEYGYFDAFFGPLIGQYGHYPLCATSG